MTRGPVQFIPWVCVFATGFLIASSGPDDVIQFSESERRIIRQFARPPVPDDPTNRVADDPLAAHFGQFLFFDLRLSRTGAIACATCHDPEHGFADSKQLGEGLGRMDRHTMSLWDVGASRWFFWDGRADTLWSQALQPMEHPLEYGSNRTRIAHVIFDEADLRQAYERIFDPMPDLSDTARFPPDARPVREDPDHPHHRAWMSMSEEDREAVNRIFSNIGKAIAAYERRLISGPSPVDRLIEALVRGEDVKNDVISPAAQRGLKLFVGKANCRLCHLGPQFSDGEFHNTGVPPLGGGMPTDSGRMGGIEQLIADEFNAAGSYSDDPEGEKATRVRRIRQTPETWGQFKTPGLRNVALTSPYMHQGQIATLRAVVEFYSTLDNRVQVGHHQETLLQPLHLSEREIEDLVAFLEALTGSPPRDLLHQPNAALPPEARNDDAAGDVGK